MQRIVSCVGVDLLRKKEYRLKYALLILVLLIGLTLTGEAQEIRGEAVDFYGNSVNHETKINNMYKAIRT